MRSRRRTEAVMGGWRWRQRCDGYELSSPIDGIGHSRGWQPGSNVSMMINEAKSAVARPEERKFLGFRISTDGRAAHRSKQPSTNLRCRSGNITCWTRRISLPQLIEELRPIPPRMARLLLLLPDPSCAHQPGSVDLPKITLVTLAAVAERAQLLQRTAPSRRSNFQCGGRHRSPTGFWRMSGHPAVRQALRNHYFDLLGLP